MWLPREPFDFEIVSETIAGGLFNEPASKQECEGRYVDGTAGETKEYSRQRRPQPAYAFVGAKKLFRSSLARRRQAWNVIVFKDDTPSEKPSMTACIHRTALYILLLCAVPASSFAAETTPLVLWGTKGAPLTPKTDSEHAGVLWLWKDLQSRQATEPTVLAAGKANMPAPTLKQWENLVEKFPTMKSEEQLRNINGFFNRWSGKEDRAAYGRDEYWASSQDFLKSGGGDCEDYALIKYQALRELGTKVDSIWLVLVTDVSRGAEHAVLLVTVGNKSFILDNLSSPVYLIMPVEAYRNIYVPRYAFSDNGALSFVPRTASVGEKNASGQTADPK